MRAHPSNAPPPTSEAGRALSRLRAFLGRYYAEQPGEGGMGVGCSVCGGHGGIPHPLCGDLDALADLNGWTQEERP